MEGAGPQPVDPRYAQPHAPLLGVPMDHRETYFLLRDVVHEVDVSGQTEIEAYEDQPHRWWSAAEIAVHFDFGAGRCFVEQVGA
mgnify:CR=1 FL=1